jgi:hypothetical protein
MRARIPYVAAVGALSVLAACSGQEQSASTAQPAAPTAITIHAQDFAYTMPDSVTAGYVVFTLTNDGPSFHHATIVLLDSGRTLSELAAALKTPGPFPAWAVPIGGPNAPNPGTTSNTTLELAPGSYAVLCFVDIPGGVPHFAKGMMHALTVVGGGTAAQSAAPTADVDLSLVEYGFKFSTPLTAGHHVISVTNSGAQPHEVELLKLAPGKTPDDVIAWMQKPNGPPPAAGIGGVSFEAPGRTSYFSADLTPGNYLAVCFIPDAKDGKPHFAHGMMQTITIT